MASNVTLNKNPTFLNNTRAYSGQEDCWNDDNMCSTSVPYNPCPPPVPANYCRPRTKYDVNFVYINSEAPSTRTSDFVDRIAQTLFWTELFRGEIISCNEA